MDAEDVVARARANLGVRFRPQGRDAEHGLDCIGVMTNAFGLTGVRQDYQLRSNDVAEVERGFAASGFVRLPPAAQRPGDVLLGRVDHAQLHVVLLTPGGYLHADAGLRRVVEVPGRVPWPVASAWRHVERPDGERN